MQKWKLTCVMYILTKSSYRRSPFTLCDAWAIRWSLQRRFCAAEAWQWQCSCHVTNQTVSLIHLIICHLLIFLIFSKACARKRPKTPTQVPKPEHTAMFCNEQVFSAPLQDAHQGARVTCLHAYPEIFVKETCVQKNTYQRLGGGRRRAPHGRGEDH